MKGKRAGRAGKRKLPDEWKDENKDNEEENKDANIDNQDNPQDPEHKDDPNDVQVPEGSFLKIGSKI